jgi:hypothetical protein
MKRIILSVILVAALPAVSPVSAASYRDTVTVPPVEVYRSMIRFADTSQLDKINGSLSVLAPIVNHIKGKFKNDPGGQIEKAIRGGNPETVRRSIFALIVWDIKDLLEESLSQARDSVDEGKTSIKIARLEYEILSPVVQKKDFAADQIIKRSFMSLYQTISKDVYSSQSHAPNIARARESLVRIGLKLGSIFLN